MEISPRHQEFQNSIPSLLPSPNSSTSSSSNSSSSPRPNTNNNNNGLIIINNNNNNNSNLHPLPPQSPLQNQHKPITRSESSNPYPTTFVQADTSSFKQVVQMLTGSSKPTTTTQPDPSSKTHIPPIKSIPKKQQQSGFKLYERRNSLKNLKINPLNPIFNPNNSGFSPRKPEILSPSILDFPALVLSPVTPLIPDPFDRSGSSNYHNLKNLSPSLNKDAEDRAIKEKGFYLHPSPATTPRDSEPRLLPLFPVTSPRVSGSTTSSGSS